VMSAMSINDLCGVIFQALDDHVVVSRGNRCNLAYPLP
jgi:hypothetical protein